MYHEHYFSPIIMYRS